MCFILLGDIGGTNIRLYLIESDYDLKNFYCKLSANYLQKTTVTVNGDKKEIQTYTDIYQPLHDFLSEFSKIFQENLKHKSEDEQKFIMENPEYMTYTKRSITSDGQINETQEKYLRFWTGEPINYKDPKAKLYRLFCAVAIAGNPVNNVIKKLSNISWGLLDGNEIKNKLKLGCFYMLNDFHANGYGVLSLANSKLNMINRHIVKKMNKKNKKKGNDKQVLPNKKYLSDIQIQNKELTIIMGMGTGLGVCGVITKNKKEDNPNTTKDKNRIHLFLNPNSKQVKTPIDCSVFEKDVLVMPSEGGHVGFPFFESGDNFDLEFQKFVKEQKDIDFSYISQELLYCGQGIPLIYQFINKIKKTGNDSKPTGKQIFGLAMSNDAIALETFDKFLEYLGISIYTISVMYVNHDKFVLMGNIINSVYRKLYKNDKKKFWSKISKRLLAKTHFTQMLKKLKIYVYDDSDVMGINGIFNYLYLNHIKPGY